MYLLSVANDAELEIAALTSSERTHWSQVRKKYFFEGSNKESLETIEESLFMVGFIIIEFIRNDVIVEFAMTSQLSYL